MRRTAFICTFLLGLALPASALALHTAPGDGTLVVKNGQGPRNVPVVTLVISGAAIGHVSGYGSKIVIDNRTNAANSDASFDVTGATSRVDTSDTATQWTGLDFRFRAVGGVYVIKIYGGYVDLVASGHGTVALAGLADTPSGDGWYSLNGNPWSSLPSMPTKNLAIGAVSTSSG